MNLEVNAKYQKNVNFLSVIFNLKLSQFLCDKSVSLSTWALHFVRVNFLKIHVTYLLIIFQLFSFNDFNTLSANFTKWSNTLTQFVGKLPTNCLSVFDHLVGLARRGLILHFN